jgi:hypothetical protein
MKEIILLSISLLSLCCYAQKKDENSGQQIHQEAWLKGLSSTVDTTGIPVEVMDFTEPQPGKHQFDITLQTTPELESILNKHSSAKSVFPKMSIVVRKDAKSKLDEGYHLANARIVTVQQSVKQQGAVDVTISFNNVTKITASSWNPGPPPRAPSVRAAGMNPGWICETSADGTVLRKELQIVDFKLFCFESQLLMTFEKSSSDVRQFFPESPIKYDLILVLPDRNTLSYVEIKLRNVKITCIQDNTHQIVIQSDMIECLTGERNSN